MDNKVMASLVYPLPRTASLQGFQWFEFNALAFLDSTTRLRFMEDRRRRRDRGYGVAVALTLWCKAFTQTPAGTLPDDDRQLCGLAGFADDFKGWMEVREEAMRGFVPIVDRDGRSIPGRLGHERTIIAAEHAWDFRQREAKKRADDQHRANRKALRAACGKLGEAAVKQVESIPNCDLVLACMEENRLLPITLDNVTEAFKAINRGWRRPEMAEIIPLKSFK